MSSKLATFLTCAITCTLPLGLLQVLPGQSGEPEKASGKSAGANESKPKTTRKRKAPRRRRDQVTTTAVHKAWLAEIVDLDREVAIESYDEIIKDSPKDRPERWLAVGRLRELARLGVLTPEPTATPSQEPPAVKKALSRLEEPFPFREVLRRPNNGEQLPPLRPATPQIQSWVRDQIGLTFRERYSAAMRNRNWRGRSSSENTYWFVVDIMRREVEGNRPQANALRAWYFPNWTPPELTAKPTAALTEARKRLTKWIEEEPISGRREELRRLEKGIETQAKAGHNRVQSAKLAVELIRRLPFYAPRLLGPPEKPGDDKKPK